MSDIHFSASLDTKQLDTAVKQSNQTIKQWAEGVEKAGGQADGGLNKMTKSFKQTIAEQKILIKSIEEDVKRLQKAYDDATAGKAKQAAGGDLRSAKRALAEEQGTLLGLQKQQIEANNKESDSAEGLIGKLKGWAMGLASVGAAMKIAKDIIASTEGSAHKFEVVVAEATAGVGYFFKSIASGDWSNFLNGISEAIKGAVDYVNAMEDIQNRQNEQKIKSAEISSQIAELRTGTFDRDIENNDKLITNLTKIIALQKIDYANQAKIAKDTYNITVDAAAKKNGINKDTLDILISEYTKNKEIIELGEAYNKKQDALNTIRSLQPNAKVIPELEKEIAAMGEAGKAAGEMALKYGKVPIPLRTSLAALKAEQIQLEGQAKIGSKFDERRLATAENLKKTTEEDAAKKAIEDAKIENRIKTQEELLNKAIESNNITEIKAISERIRKLQEELLLRERIANAAIAATMTREDPLTKITGLKLPSLSSFKVSSDLAKMPVTSKKSKYIAGTAILTPEAIAEQKKAGEEQNRIDEKRISNNEKIFQGALRITMQLGQQIGLSEQELTVLDSTLSAFSNLAKGDYLGAALSLITGLMSTIPTEAQKFEAQIERINAAIKEQQRLIELSKRTGGEAEAMQANIDLLKQEAAAISAALSKELSKFSPNGKRVDELTASWTDVVNQIKDAQLALDDFLAGGITENTIADSIAQGFRDGKTSVDDFADYMNTMLLDAVMNIFKGQLLSSPQMKVFTDDLKTFMEDQVLTPEEVAKLRQDQLDIVNANKPGFDALTQGLNLSGNAAQSSMVGTLTKVISEDTASEWVGLARRQADDLRNMKDYSKQGVNHLVGIENNTFQTVVQLQLAVVELRSIVTNTKPVYAGTL